MNGNWINDNELIITITIAVIADIEITKLVLTVTDIQCKDLKPNVIHTPYFGDDSPTFRNEPGKRNEEF